MVSGIRAFVTAVALVGALAACSATSGYSDLDRAPTSEDVLPSDVTASASDNFDVDSTRYVGRHDGVSYYLAQAVATPGVCVVIYRAAESWVVGCGAGVTVSGMGITASAIPDGGVVPEGGTLVGHNVVVLQSSGP